MTLGVRDVGAALASGLLLAAAFPPLAQGWVAWLALVPLLLALRGASAGRAFVVGWLGGTVAYGLVTCWLTGTLARFTSLGFVGSLVAHAAMAGVLGTYVGLFAVAAAALSPLRAPLFWIPTAWVITEWLRGVFPIGFPWARLGASQVALLAVAQAAELVSVYGLSWAVVAGNTAVALWLAGDRSRWHPLGAAVGLVAMALAGALRLAQVEARGAPRVLRVALVETMVTQERKWTPSERDIAVRELTTLTAQAARTRPDVILWPETATPFSFDDDPDGRRVVTDLVAGTHIPIVFGSPAYERPAPDRARRLNRVYVLTPEGMTRTYDKRVLVPFGEYVPFGRWLPFVRPVIAGERPVSAGSAGPPLDVAGVPIGVLVCYEALEPWLAREWVRGGARVLVNASNDAWFAGTAASEQLLAEARMRAIEQRVPVVRVANHGPSAIIAPSGRVLWQGGGRGAAWHAADVRWTPVEGPTP